MTASSKNHPYSKEEYNEYTVEKEFCVECYTELHYYLKVPEQE